MWIPLRFGNFRLRASGRRRDVDARVFARAFARSSRIGSRIDAVVISRTCVWSLIQHRAGIVRRGICGSRLWRLPVGGLRRLLGNRWTDRGRTGILGGRLSQANSAQQDDGKQILHISILDAKKNRLVYFTRRSAKSRGKGTFGLNLARVRGLGAGGRGLRVLVCNFIGHQTDVHTAVLRPAAVSLVRRHWFVLAQPDHVELVGGNVVVLRQVLDHHVGALLAQDVVRVLAANGVSSALNFNNEVLLIRDLGR